MEENNNEPRSLKYPVGELAIIVASFLLAILDMTFLYKALQNIIPGLERFMAMLVALILATVANFTALMWGRANGEHLKKSLNKHSIGFFIGWLIIGFIYAGIRTYNIIKGVSTGRSIDIGGEIVQIIILAVSYIGTGTLIAQSEARIRDKIAVRARKEKKEFELLHAELAEKEAEIEKTISTLDSFDEIYQSLDNQYDKIKESIFRAEKASMEEVTGKIIEQNPGITPSHIYAVRDEFLESRKNENAEIIQDQTI